MRRIVLCVLVAAVLPGLAAAFEGIVVGVDGRPLAGARISVAGQAGTTLADGDGRFRLEPDPEPPFVLLVARPDGVAFRPVTVVELPAGGPLEVRVEPLGETVTVVSGAAPDLELPPAAAVTVLGRSELEQRQPEHLADAIREVAGASASGVGPASVPAVRGLPKGRTLLILDHGRVTTERRAGASATFVDMETIDEVEVIRGPGSVAYGSDAFGGVIRMRSRMPEAGGPLEVRGGAGYATGIRDRSVWGEVSGSGLLAGLSWRKQDDYESPEGTVPSTGAETRSLRLGWQQELGGGVLRLGWRTDLGRDIGKPKPNPAKRYSYPEENSHRLDVAWDRPLAGAWRRLGVSLAWDSYQLILNKDRLDDAAFVKSRKQSDTDARDYDLRVEVERGLGDARLLLGLDVAGRYGLHAVNRAWTGDGMGGLLPVTSEVSIDDARRMDAGLFAGLSGNLGRVSLSGGLRFDTVRSENRRGYFGDTTVDNSSPSGFAAAGIDLGRGVLLDLQVAAGFRDARLSDRFYRGETGRGFITGNPDLEPETSRQLDVALRWNRGVTQLAAYAYLYRIRDLIERYKEDGNYFFRNRGKAELHGFELEATFEVGPRTVLRAGAWWERGEVVGPGDPVDDIPAPGISLSLRRTTGGGLSWFVRGMAMARKTRPGPSEREEPGYAVLDAGLGLPLGRGLELRVLGRNLLDRAYLASTDEDAVLAPGRSLGVMVRMRL